MMMMQLQLQMQKQNKMMLQLMEDCKLSLRRSESPPAHLHRKVSLSAEDAAEFAEW